MTSLQIALGLILVIGGIIYMFWAKNVWPWIDRDPFESQTKNELWNHFLPYLFGLAVLATVIGASILRKNGVDLGWHGE